MKPEFGPNQDRVDAVLARLDGITHEMAMFLGTFDPDAPERRRARDAMRRSAATGGREEAVRAAQREVEAWVNRWFAGGPMIAGYGRDTTPAEAGARAAPAILDAVGATVVRDLLTEEDLDILTTPWRALWDER